MSKYKKARERVNWYRQHGICYRCGQADAVQSGMCEKCRAKINAQAKAWQEKNRAAGLCPYCGKNPPEPGRKRCRQCAEKTAESYKRYYQRHRTEKTAGQCRWCGRPSVTGYQYCPEHLETLRANIAKAREKRILTTAAKR